MNCEPKVNIIRPVYNGEKYIERFYRSIKAIDYENLSIIAVNDGSTDDSDSILAALSACDKRITYINKGNNEGVSKARNDAPNIADGFIIMYIMKILNIRNII